MVVLLFSISTIGVIKIKKLTIGEMSSISHVPITTLRYYDQQDLVKPFYVDEKTGYRYYTWEQFWHIEVIKMCRLLDLSLKDIKKVLRAQSNLRLEEVIKCKEQQVEQDLKEVLKLKSDLAWLHEQLEINRSKDFEQIVVKHIPERKVIYASASDKKDTHRLQVEVQKVAGEDLENSHSIRRAYGYVLEWNELKKGEVSFEGEYVELMCYGERKKEEFYIIPEGDYLCTYGKIHKDKKWISKILDYLTRMELEPKMIVASEVSIYFFDYKDTQYEIQILV